MLNFKVLSQCPLLNVMLVPRRSGCMAQSFTQCRSICA